MLYITSLVLIYLITGSLYLLTAFMLSPLLPLPDFGNHKSDLGKENIYLLKLILIVITSRQVKEIEK